MRAWITDSSIDPATVLEEVGDPRDGAILLFLGTVRDHNDGRTVSGMRYEAFMEMAESELSSIAADAAAQAGSDRIAVVHRVGELAIGEISVAVAVSTPHRAEAFEAARTIMEQIKARVPVWKHEHYVDGDSTWLDGTVPEVK